MAHEIYIEMLADAVKSGKITIEQVEACYRAEVETLLSEVVSE